MPTIAFALGVAWARGWLRSPVNISRDRETAPAAPNEWNGYGGENE
ncbi:MAG TPA: hypothetical protein G4N96_12035 [Chloroflexi bacterium]|nr:hypothetical protein [Chloroflexota bacterium]